MVQCGVQWLCVLLFGRCILHVALYLLHLVRNICCHQRRHQSLWPLVLRVEWGWRLRFLRNVCPLSLQTLGPITNLIHYIAKTQCAGCPSPWGPTSPLPLCTRVVVWGCGKVRGRCALWRLSGMNPLNRSVVAVPANPWWPHACSASIPGTAQPGLCVLRAGMSSTVWPHK